MKINWLAIGLTIGACFGAAAQLAHAEDKGNGSGVEETRTMKLQPGDVLGQDNGQDAEGLLPPEILRHYKEGRYSNSIIDWPQGIYRWDPELKAASEDNNGKFTISPEGSIVEKSTAKQPPFIFGLPFTQIDPKDRDAAIKIMWNYQYQYWSEGSNHNQILLAWTNPTGVDRESTQDVHFLFYDGQNPDYRLPNPNNFSGQFIAVSTSPADLNGTAALTWRYRDPDKRDSNWTYVPALRRIRAVSPANRSDGFLGSDMSQDDGPFFDGKLEDFTWKLAGEEEMYVFVDGDSFTKPSGQFWLPAGGWRSVWDDRPIVGFQKPEWQGLAWAPLASALAKRSVWIVEAVPKDRYYLYGRLQLYVDKETYQGAYSRKFGWNGEHLNTLVVIAYQKEKLQRPDGKFEYMWGSSHSYLCAENLKLNRATIGGLTPRGKDVPNDRRVRYDPKFFDFNTLNRFGK